MNYEVFQKQEAMYWKQQLVIFEAQQVDGQAILTDKQRLLLQG